MNTTIYKHFIGIVMTPKHVMTNWYRWQMLGHKRGAVCVERRTHGFEREGDRVTYHSTLSGWHESGKRVKRGLYRTVQNVYINADCNGAANILRKVATTLGLDLEGVGRGALTTPLKFRIWTLKESHVL